MKHAIDLDAGCGIARERAEKNSAKRITERDAVASFQGLDNELALATAFIQIIRGNIRLFDFDIDHCVTILLIQFVFGI